MRRTPYCFLLLGSWFLSLGASAGPLLNGSFTDFDGWSGSIRDSDTDVLVDVDPATDARFSLIGSGFAQLSNDSEYYEVILYQDFDLLSDASTLSFDYSWSLTASDPSAPDLVQATLWLADFSDFIDLFPPLLDTSAPSGAGNAITDVSAFAGESVSIEFLVQDGDFNESDWLQIGNITIAEAPLPGPWTLVLAGFVPLLGARLTRRHPRPQRPRCWSAPSHTKAPVSSPSTRKPRIEVASVGHMIALEPVDPELGRKGTPRYEH